MRLARYRRAAGACRRRCLAAAAAMEAGHLADSFGGAEDVLLAQEVKLEQLQGENRCVGW